MVGTCSGGLGRSARELEVGWGGQPVSWRRWGPRRVAYSQRSSIPFLQTTAFTRVASCGTEDKTLATHGRLFAFPLLAS